MIVTLVNGSHHRDGNTARALREVAVGLGEGGVEARHFWIGPKPVGGCAGCEGCSRLGKCVFDDVVNEFREVALESDGFVFGAPVHYAHAGASMLGFLDRTFYSNGRAGEPDALSYKPAAAVAIARRAGTTSALDDINKFMTISQMPVVSSVYWNDAFGEQMPDVERDEEGMHVMRQLGRNMAWVLRCVEAGRAAGIEPPASEAHGPYTNFIR